jgi:hypothetical protein
MLATLGKALIEPVVNGRLVEPVVQIAASQLWTYHHHDLTVLFVVRRSG